MNIKVTVQGLDTVAKMTENLVPNFQREVPKYLEQVAKSTRRNVRRLTPIKTGHLRGSWQMEAGGFHAEVFTDVDYALWVEIGHDNNRGFVRGYWRNGKFWYDPTSKTGSVFTGYVTGRLFVRNGLDDSLGMIRAEAIKTIRRIVIF